MSVPFSLRVRLGRCEIEISGSRDDVLQTVKDLPSLVGVVSEAFTEAGVDVSSVTTAFESSSAVSSSANVSTVYPSIQSSGNCSDAVLKLLSTDWGKAMPRMLPELIEAMRANAIHYPATTLSGVLNWLVRKGKVKRWKTDKGYVYVLATPNVSHGHVQAQTETNMSVASSGGE